MIALEIFATQRTWTEEPRSLPKRRSRGPGRLRSPVQPELASSWWARTGKKIRQVMRSLHRPPANGFARWYKTECSRVPSAPGAGVGYSAYTREELLGRCRSRCALQGAPIGWIVTSEMKGSEAPALWALSARGDGGPVGVDHLDTSHIQAPDPREIPRVLSQPG